MANLKGARHKGIEFWRSAVERLNRGEKAQDVARELGVDRSGLQRWQQRLNAGGPEEINNPRQREAGLRKEVEQLKRALGEKALEVDFLRGALHKVEERRRKRGSSGAQASTTRSGK